MRKWIKISLWSLFIIGVVVVGVMIKQRVDKQVIVAPKIEVKVDGENAFITGEELFTRLKDKNLYRDGITREELNIGEIEAYIASISQVKNVSVYQQIDGNWSIEVEMRKPVARIFNIFGETFYLDEDGVMFETIPTHTARSLVFTGEIKDRVKSESVVEIINNDSLKSIRKLDDIYRISNYVCNDPVFQSLVGQVHLKKNGDFILVPLVGDQKIVFGSAFTEKEVEEKFEKLRIFYEEAIPYEGWNTYTEISLKFKDQIVCKKKKTDE